MFNLSDIISNLFGEGNTSQQELEKQELEKQKEALKKLGLDYIRQLKNNPMVKTFNKKEEVYKHLYKKPEIRNNNGIFTYKFSCWKDFDTFLKIIDNNFKVDYVQSKYFDSAEIQSNLPGNNVPIAITEEHYEIISNVNLIYAIGYMYTKNGKRNQEIIDEFKNILGQDKNQDENVVSLFDLFHLIEQKIISVANISESIRERLNELNVKSLLENASDDAKKLFISYDIGSSRALIFINYSPDIIIVYNPENNDIYIDEETTETEDIEFAININLLDILGDDLVNLFKEGYSLDFVNSPTIIETVNSKFHVIITNTGILIQFIDYYASLSLEYFSHEKKYNCLSYNVLKNMRDNGEEVFKNLFVRIENCPKYLQSELRELRNNQLEGKRKDFHL